MEKIIEKLDKFIEEHILMDELDGVERTLVEFNFNEWIRFKRQNFDGKERIEVLSPIPTLVGIKQRDEMRDELSKQVEKEEKPKRKRRIKKQRDDLDDDSIDELELD